jgi:hypothetical protein
VRGRATSGKGMLNEARLAPVCDRTGGLRLLLLKLCLLLLLDTQLLSGKQGWHLTDPSLEPAGVDSHGVVARSALREDAEYARGKELGRRTGQTR